MIEGAGGGTVEKMGGGRGGRMQREKGERGQVGSD